MLGLEVGAARRHVGRDERGRLALAEGVQRLQRRHGGDMTEMWGRYAGRGRGKG